jgi:hypothetical protein
VAAGLAAMDQAIKEIQSEISSYVHRGNDSVHSKAVSEVSEEGQRQQATLEAELKLFLTTPAPSVVSQVHVTTHGRNSPVNVGGGTLRQRIDSGASMADLAQALAELLTAIDQYHHGKLAEERDVLEEAQVEANRAEPNRLRLKSILAGCKDGIQTVASLQPAWQSAQRLAQMLGLM